MIQVRKFAVDTRTLLPCNVYFICFVYFASVDIRYGRTEYLARHLKKLVIEQSNVVSIHKLDKIEGLRKRIGRLIGTLIIQMLVIQTIVIAGSRDQNSNRYTNC